MAMRKGAHSYNLVCDACGKTIDAKTKDFKAALDIQRFHNWRSYKGPSNEWKTACHECVVEFAKERHEKQGWT